MFAVIVDFMCSLIMSLYGIYIIKKITKSEERISRVKNVLLVIILTTVTVLLKSDDYAALYSISIFILNIIIYKNIFNLTLEKALIACGILMTITLIGDLVVGLFFIKLSAYIVRTTWYMYIISTNLVVLLGIAIMNIKSISRQLENFYINMSKKETISNILFLTILIIGLILLIDNIWLKTGFSKTSFTNLIITVIFIFITYLFIKSKNNYSELSSEYDSLFLYIQNFEEWIEKEQLNRHEYKNQLAVLSCLTEEKRVKDKIDEILDDNIKIEGEVVQQLKGLPKGGIKGLMYYKSAIAQKNRIRLNISVSIERKSILKKLPEKDIRILCKLIGIYFDNAIEAARETRKKEILIEIYEIKDKVNIVFSNTFKKNYKIDNINRKGISTKGKGRGNGLYFASKLINNNKWLSQKQEIIDKYYIQTLTINNKNTI